VRPMPEQPQLIYLEPDDEITSVMRRLRAAEGGSVVIVAPGRSRATSSAVALRLLAQVAAEEARSLSLVADAPTRALAGEAGIAAFASVAEATSGIAAPDHTATPRAPIHVVRGASEAAAFAGAPTALAGRSTAGDETVAVRLPPRTASGGSGPRGRRRSLRPRWPWLAGLLVLVVIVSAVLLPGATVSITLATQPVGPKTYQLHLPIAGRQSADIRVTRPGTATGTRSDLVAASGNVTLFNWSLVAQPVAKGTQVSAGRTIAFTTTERIVVQRGKFNGLTIKPGQGSVGVVAVAPGPAGNVAAGAIDTIDDVGTRTALRGSPDNPNSLVTNPEPTTGGLDTPHTVIQQSDVDAVVAALQTDIADHLAAALAGQPDRVYAGPPATEVPQITVPPGLVGTEDQATFELTGTLAFDRPYVVKGDLDAAARAALHGDPGAAPSGTSILQDSIQVAPGTATVNGDEMTIAVTVRAAAAVAIDKGAIRDKVVGKTVDEARAALADQGEVRIDLWPGWLDRLPRIPFRITILTVAPAPSASPSP
jgi:hypothetical protein